MSSGRKEWKKKQRRRNAGKTRIALIFGMVGILLLLLFVFLLFFLLREYGKSDKLYEQAREAYLEPQETEGAFASEAAFAAAWTPALSPDLAALFAEYPDVVGWIDFENEEISYPILYSGDNEKYLDHSYNGESLKSGSIFLDGESSTDLSDPHTLIYGHNMRDLSMFGRLKYYASDPQYYAEHPYFDIYVGDRVYRYRVFACEEVEDSDLVYYVYGKDPENLKELIALLYERSYYPAEEQVTPSDHIVTLSTCTESDEKRIIVCGVRTEEYQRQDGTFKAAG